MNTTFSFNRLVLMLKRFFIENRNKEIMSWGILILVFTLVHNSANAKILLYIMGFILAAKQLKSFAYTPGGMHYFLIPSTHLEKLVTSILLSTVYFFTMFILTYSIGNVIGTNLYNLVFTQSTQVTWDFFNATDIQKFGGSFDFLPGGNAFLEMIVNFLIIQSTFMLGSIYFKRGALGKTMLSILAFYFVIGLIELFLLKVIFVDLTTLRGMNSFSFMTESSSILKIIANGFKIFCYLLIPYFWTVTYFRLTEKQV